MRKYADNGTSDEASTAQGLNRLTTEESQETRNHSAAATWGFGHQQPKKLVPD
jgi:hypothetical protein